ncbi:MAG: hypothetical protein JHC31_08385 [Sulfurihydrogenibium sp.]|jgi:hypothetical protein|nr:hypothetical protein [Sulfurihydrogenibium sp.]
MKNIDVVRKKAFDLKVNRLECKCNNLINRPFSVIANNCWYENDSHFKDLEWDKEDVLDYCNNENCELDENVEVDYSTYYNAYLDLVEQQISYEINIMTQLALAKIEYLSL